MDNLEQCYQVLGVSSDASIDEIKQAYKDLVQVWHPDRYAHNSRLQRKAEAKLKAINSAYEIIMESLASGRTVSKATNVYENESSSTQVSQPEPVVEAVEVKTNLLLKVKSWINKNKWILITGTGAASILISLQIYAYTKYKDFPFFNPILLIQRISSSFFLERNILGDELGYSSIKFSSNGAIFSSAYPWSTEMKIWDFYSEKKLKSFPENNFNSGYPRAINLELKYLVSKDNEEIKVWNIENNKLLRTISIGKSKYNIVTENSKYLLAFYNGFNSILYDLKNGQLIRSFERTWLLHVSDDGKIIIGVVVEYISPSLREEKLKIWNIKTGQEYIVEKTLNNETDNEKGWKQPFSVIDSDVNQNLLRTKRSALGRSYLEVRQLDTGKLINVKNLNCNVSDSYVLGSNKSYKISPDSKLLVNLLKSSDSDHFIIEVCDLTNGERVHTLSKIANYLEVEFSPDSKILAISNRNSWNKTIELYNLETRKIDQSFIDVTNSISLNQTLSFTPDGRFLLTGSDNGMRIWRIR